jgi:hypothetical protein
MVMLRVDTFTAQSYTHCHLTKHCSDMQCATFVFIVADATGRVVLASSAHHHHPAILPPNVVGLASIWSGHGRACIVCESDEQRCIQQRWLAPHVAAV